MHAGIHAVGTGVQRVAVVLILGAFAIVMAYAVLVFVILVIQSASAFGQS